jgi:hypothetical protein
MVFSQVMGGVGGESNGHGSAGRCAAAAFARQSAVSTELYEFSVCVGLIEES